MPPASQTIPAKPADQMPFPGDQISWFEAGDIVPNLSYSADKLVADDHGDFDSLLGPAIPIVDMDVGAADGGFNYFDEDIIHAGLWNGNFLEPESGFGFLLNQGLHCAHEILQGI